MNTTHGLFPWPGCLCIQELILIRVIFNFKVKMVYKHNSFYSQCKKKKLFYFAWLWGLLNKDFNSLNSWCFLPKLLNWKQKCISNHTLARTSLDHEATIGSVSHLFKYHLFFFHLHILHSNFWHICKINFDNTNFLLLPWSLTSELFLLVKGSGRPWFDRVIIR